VNTNELDKEYRRTNFPNMTAIRIQPDETLQPGNPFTRDELRGMWELYDLRPQHLPLHMPRVVKSGIMDFLKSCFEDSARLSRREKEAKMLYDKVKATPARKLARLIKAADVAVAFVG
jgi:hypothetical protein